MKTKSGESEVYRGGEVCGCWDSKTSEVYCSDALCGCSLACR